MSDRTVRLTAAVSRDGDLFVARCLEVELASRGRSVDDALADLEEALELYFEDEPSPAVTEVITAPIEIVVA